MGYTLHDSISQCDELCGTPATPLTRHNSPRASTMCHFSTTIHLRANFFKRSLESRTGLNGFINYEAGSPSMRSIETGNWLSPILVSIFQCHDGWLLIFHFELDVWIVALGRCSSFSETHLKTDCSFEVSCCFRSNFFNAILRPMRFWISCSMATSFYLKNPLVLTPDSNFLQNFIGELLLSISKS